MPYDQKEPSRWADTLARLKLLRRRARSEDRKERRYSKARLIEAERLLAEVIDRGDLIAEVITEDRLYERPRHYSELCLLVTLDPRMFERLCAFDAEAADFEDTNDAEPEVDEHTLGRTERLMQPEEFGADDVEPSLASTGMVDQRRWHDGGSDDDSEFDKADAEPDYDDEPDDRRLPRVQSADGEAPVDLAGMWALQRKAGAK